MPTGASKSKKSQEELFEHIEPTLNSLKDVEDAVEAWSKYWPFLKTDQHLI
jgi:hypothetical protein